MSIEDLFSGLDLNEVDIDEAVNYLNDKLKKAENIIDTCYKTTKDLSEVEFMTCICMLLEKYCAHNKKDIEYLTEGIYQAVVDVNREKGPYKEED